MSFVLRLASLSDGPQLLAWRNHPQVRQSSLNSALIDEASHREWLEKTLRDNRTLLLLLEQNGLGVGTLRSNRENDNRIFLSWTIAPDTQGQGIGTILLQQFCRLINTVLFARIKSANIASAKIAEKAGFTCLETQDGLGIWRRPPYAQKCVNLAEPLGGKFELHNPQAILNFFE